MLQAWFANIIHGQKWLPMTSLLHRRINYCDKKVLKYLPLDNGLTNWRQDIQHNNTKQNDIQQNDNQQKGIQQNDKHLE